VNVRIGVVILWALLPSSASAAAQGLAVDALLVAEAWKTDSGSRLLARNDGDLALQGYVYVWAVLRASRTVEIRAIGSVAAGNLTDESVEVDGDQLSLRYLPARALVLEGGKILMPVGQFGARRLPHTNPLIGTPDAYPTLYPWGATASGAAGSFDYRVGVMSLPVVNARYTPEAGHRLRPVAGVGWSAGPAFRVGAAVTRGPYLSSDVQALLPPGEEWTAYTQDIIAAEARFALGYVEARAEAQWSSYEVPTHGDPVHGFGWYAEVRATLAPRVFAAARYEDYRYPFVLPVSPSFWVGSETTQRNGEVGAGYRFGPSTLLKASVRLDHWPVHELPNGQRFPDGYAVAVQGSVLASLTNLLTPRY
jgi:hypothetical protein